MFMSKIISLENEISKRIIIDLAVPGYRRDPAVHDNEIDDKALCVIEGIPLCCARGMTVCCVEGGAIAHLRCAMALLFLRHLSSRMRSIAGSVRCKNPPLGRSTFTVMR